jgi:hypothetical protein
MNHWPKIYLWHLAQMKGDLQELCDVLSCSQVARVVAVISYSDGRSSIRKYCSANEPKALAKLKRNHPGVEPIDHRGPALTETARRVSARSSGN